MIRSLTSAVSGIQQFQLRMDVIGNNIANVNTVAFKSARTNLADSFSQTLASSNLGGDAAAQVGLGVITSGIYNQYTQGAINRTGVETDLAISGEGFFVVRDPLSGNVFVTRAGDFRIDSDNYLITNGGLRVQGYNNIGLDVIGDIQIDAAQRPPTADPTATMASFGIDGLGRISVRLSDGTEYVRAQILLQNFTNPQALMKEGNNLYSGIGAAGPLGGALNPTPAPPGSNGLGRIQSGALELSNVDLSNEFSNLIQTQRAFQANARIISTTDEMLQELVNLKR
ncbi:MAG: flagellar hook-basal body complex protein [Verrucomicrobiae bacterium]|nr:flagellar hook-basal body complex protein [Verrucomicrobiae bacterium]